MKNQVSDELDEMMSHLSFQLIYVNHGIRNPGFDTEWRRLPGTLIEIPWKGDWKLSVEGSSRHYIVRSNEVAIIPAGTFHRLQMDGSHPMHTFYLLGNFWWINGVDVIRSAKLPLLLSQVNGRKLIPILRQMASVTKVPVKRFEILAQMHTLAFQVLEMILAFAENPNIRFPVPILQKIQPALTRIRTNPFSHHKCTDLARASHLSPTHFNFLFKKVMGTAPKVYMRNEKLKRACEILISTDRPVYEIAEICGFSSSFYFCRQFSRYIGQSPNQFRKKLKWENQTKVASVL